MKVTRLKQHIQKLTHIADQSLIVRIEIRILIRLIARLENAAETEKTAIFNDFFNSYMKLPNNLIAGLGIREIRDRSKGILTTGKLPDIKTPGDLL